MVLNQTSQTVIIQTSESALLESALHEPGCSGITDLWEAQSRAVTNGTRKEEEEEPGWVWVVKWLADVDRDEWKAVG